MKNEKSKMNPKVKKLWVDSLKKEEYNQGQYKLRKDDEMCCLGVLCELHRRSTKSSKNYWNSQDVYVAGKNRDGYILPNAVSKWANIDNDPEVSGRSLSSLNDSGSSFKEIAKIIQKEL